MDERAGLVGRSSSVSSQQDVQPDPVNQTQGLIHQGLLAVIGGMALITFILAIYRGAVVEHYGATYFFLGFVNLAIVLLESLMIYFVRNGQMDGNKLNFFYIMGATTFIQSLFTDIVLFSQ